MKKFFLLTMASLMTVFAMATGRGDGSTPANAIDFDWDKGVEHPGGNVTLYYRVDLAPLYEEDNPSLTLYLTNPSRDASADVSMEATVLGQKETKDYTIGAHQYKTYTANAKTLVTLKQTEISLCLKASGKIKLSAKVFEAADLDETCKDASVLKWDVVSTQTAGYAAWWKVDLKPVKNATKKDAKITITNIGSKMVTLKAGQSLDCPSSGLTKRTYDLNPGQVLEDTIPQSMITSVQPDELYFSIENLDAPVSMKVELVDQPAEPIIPAKEVMPAVNLHVTDTIVIPAGTTLYRVSVADMDSLNKYEPEFTYRNEGAVAANVTIKMAFERPAFGTSNTEYNLAAGEEEIVVYKKNMLEGMSDVDSIFLLTTCDQPINFYGRFKHVREGKACKTNIEFNWESGHTQEARTTQWYAINVADARDHFKDIVIYLQNEGKSEATVKASVAFSCPYIDLQEVTRKIAAKSSPISRRMTYSSYAMMDDIIYIGLETDEDIKFWADTVDAEQKDTPDPACLSAVDFDWKDGVKQNANDVVWYKIDMTKVREEAAKFPTINVQNYGDAEATITAEISLECPDVYQNEKRSTTIPAHGLLTKKISRNMFENIVQDEIWLRVVSTEDIALQIAMTEKPAGSDCESAIVFNWVSGNKQEANADLWYLVDLRNVMKRGNDIRLHIENLDNKDCKGVIDVAYECPLEGETSSQKFSLGKKGLKSITMKNSALETLEDSVVYINLTGNTSLHFWADTLKVIPFDTIYSVSPITPITWNTTYTQTVDTAWYIIPKSEIDLVRNMEEEQRPIVRMKNLAAAENTYKVEAAFALPIAKTMMSKTLTVKGNKSFKDTIPASTFAQFLKKDSILIRVTRKPGTGNFEFEAQLIKARDGNDRSSALLITPGKSLGQSANTTMWYKIDTKKWKADKSLYGKSVHMATKNAGKGDAELKVAVYEGKDTTDMIEYYTGGKKAKRTIKKGESRAHNIPGQSIFAIADKIIYIKVSTTDSLAFESSSTNYATIAPADVDKNQFKAKFVVPNADYEIPADTTMWFHICIPYLRNNFRYDSIATLEYEVEGNAPATLEVTATLQDTMTYKVPVRTRTLNKSGKERKGKQKLVVLLNKALERKGYDYDLSTFKPEFVDSMLHTWTTSDSVTAYLRIRSSRNVKVRINMPKVKGDECLNFQEFDWEHGVVNEAKDTTWYRIQMDPNRVPDGKDLKLHLDNWGSAPTNTWAHLLLGDCSGSEMAPAKKYLLKKDTARIFKREVLLNWGFTPMTLHYYSDSVTHVWAEVIDAVKPDTLRDTIRVFGCSGYTVTDIEGITKTITKDSVWTAKGDSTSSTDYYILRYLYVARLLKDPATPKIETLANKPAVTKGAVLDCSLASKDIFLALDTVRGDSIKRVGLGGDSIAWEFTTDGKNWNPIPTTPMDTDLVALRYKLTTECDDVFPSDVWVNDNSKEEIINETACADYYWAAKDSTYKKDGLNTDTIHKLVAAGPDATIYKVVRLNVTITRVEGKDFKDTVCTAQLPYTWNGRTYTASKKDTIVIKTKDGLCDSIATLDLTVITGITKTLPTETGVCQVVHNWGDGNTNTYTASGSYSHTYKAKSATECDTVVTLPVVISGAKYDTVTPSAAEGGNPQCNVYVWKQNNKSYNKTGFYNDTIRTKDGVCDSIITTLDLKINTPAEFGLDAVAKYGNRLIMINRNTINEKTGWDLEDLGAKGVNPDVVWYRADDMAGTNTKQYASKTGYYIVNNDKPGAPLQGVFWAVITIPATTPGACPEMGYTKFMDCTKVVGGAPAIIPNHVRPGEEMRVVNLDPEQETTIRVFTTEGLIQHTYVVSGEESFVIKAANEHGFYLVELRNDEFQSTLRYIVK